MWKKAISWSVKESEKKFLDPYLYLYNQTVECKLRAKWKTESRHNDS